MKLQGVWDYTEKEVSRTDNVYVRLSTVSADSNRLLRTHMSVLIAQLYIIILPSLSSPPSTYAVSEQLSVWKIVLVKVKNFFVTRSCESNLTFQEGKGE